MRSTHTPAPTVRTPLLQSNVVEDEDFTRIYKARFWVLGVFSTFGCFLAWQFNTWGPINESVVVAYPEWSSTTVALMPNLTSAVFVVFVWPVCILVQKLGLRVAMLSACSLTSFALALRCASQDPTVFTWLCMVSSSLQGVAMTIMLAVPPLLAVDWFPPSERATAQGLMFAMEQLGILVSYLEPMLVRAPGHGVTVQQLKNDISQLMYISTGCCLVLSLACFIYFPARPSAPPSAVAAADRTPLMAGLRAVCRNRKAWIAILGYFMYSGPVFVWVAVLNYSLLPFGVHQDESMWVAGTAIVVSAMASLVSGRYTDANCGRLRPTLLVLLLFTSGFFYWFLLLSEGVITYSKWQVYASVVCGISGHMACVPVFYELTQELVFPCPEVVVGGVIAFADSVSASIFLLGYQLYPNDFGWVPYVLVFSTALAVLPLLLLKVDYSRSELDARGPGADSETPSVRSCGYRTFDNGDAGITDA